MLCLREREGRSEGGKERENIVSCKVVVDDDYNDDDGDDDDDVLRTES